MMVIIGAIIVIGVIYLLLKRHESRMVLIAAGILMAVIAGVIIAATTLTILAIFLKENKGYLPESGNDAVAEDLKINPLYALMPLLPVIILLVGSTGMAPILKMGVPQAMLIGALLSLAVTRSNPTKLTKSFFDGMGDAYANIIGIIISVGVFVSGMQSLGLVKALINWMLESTGIVKIAATFGPFILAMISGSGDAATVAFNEAVTPHAAQFGLQAIDMGSMAALGGTLGRTMSPIAGATIICAGIAGVDPMEVCKRNALGITLALLAGMVILLF